MLIDMAVLTVFSWLVAKALNMVFFKEAPASKFIAWTLTFCYFICGVILASVVKFFRGAAISKSLGISMSAQNPMDMGTAFIMALVFYQVLNRASKNSANSRVKADSAAPDLSIYTPARATKSSSSVHESLQERMAVDEGAIYTAIANELESGSIDKGLWTRLFAECDGDESKTKAAYIRQRANQLLARNHLIASQGSSEASFGAPPPVETALSGDSERPSAPAKLTSPANYRNGLMVIVVLVVGGALLYWVSGKPGISSSKMADKYLTDDEVFGRPPVPKAVGNPPNAATPANSATNPSAIDCEANAVSKDGRPLQGAAKAAFIKKCKSDVVTAPVHSNLPLCKGLFDDVLDGKCRQPSRR